MGSLHDGFGLRNMKFQFHFVRSAVAKSLALSTLFFLTARAQAQVAVGPGSFCYGVLAKQAVKVSGGVIIDSFNSLDSSQSTDGLYDPSKRGDQAEIASAAGAITDSGNTQIYGQMFTSPSGKASLSGKAAVGDFAWIGGGNRGIEPGSYSNNFQATISDATLPAVTFTPLPLTSGTVHGTNYTYVVTNGDFQAASLKLSGSQSLCINGNVVLYVPGSFSVSGQAFIFIAPGASLTVYLGGQSTLSGGGAINGTQLAANCAFIGLPSCTKIQNSGKAEFIGTFYAPEAAVTFSGGGNQTVNFAGAVVGNSVTLSGNFKFHCDQGLCDSCVAPAIVVSLMNQTNCLGTEAQFGVMATGSGLSYQWYAGTTLLSNETNSTLTIPSVSAANAGAYSVVVSGACGIPVTNSAMLVLNQPVLVTTGPSNETNCPGTPAGFSVSATGTGLSYQWYQGATLIPGQVGSTLDLGPASATNAGTYNVVISDMCGNSVTTGAVLVVNATVMITTPPKDTAVCPNMPASFTVGATGTGLTYQWYNGATAIPQQTGSTLNLGSVKQSDAGTYSVVVRDSCGNTATTNATLTVTTKVLVTEHPDNATNCPGTAANFSVTALGSDLTYQWYHGTNLLPEQISNTLSVTNVQTTNAGTYKVVITGGCGDTVTNCASLVLNQPVSITTDLMSLTNCPDTEAKFVVTATGSGLTYQWYKDGEQIPGDSSNSLTLGSVSASDAGAYAVIVTDACGGMASNSAVLVVNQNVTVAPLANVTNNVGAIVTFSAIASGTGPFGYQWYLGAVPLSNQTNSTLTVTLEPGTAGAYSVSVTGACGNGASTGAILAINQPPVANIIYPTNGQVFVAPATFNVTATASDPDGVVTNVEFFESTNGEMVLIGGTNSAPYSTILSNLPAGTYTFLARAWDNLGATGDSTPVTVSVVPPQPPSVTQLGDIGLNTQDGYLWLTNVACNPELSSAGAMKIEIHGITNSAIAVVNATGTNNGVPYVESAGAIEPGQCYTNIIRFYDPVFATLSPTLSVDLLVGGSGAGLPPSPSGTVVPILFQRTLPGGTFLIEFATISGKTYYVQYRDNPSGSWLTVPQAYTGTGQDIQWIDSGPPLTQSLPGLGSTRSYQVLMGN